MKFSLRRDTLAFQLSRPGVVHRSLAHVPVPDVAKQIVKFRSVSNVAEYIAPGTPALCAPKGDPEDDAITFYMLNHAVALLRQRFGPYDPLGEHVVIVEEYHKWLSVLSARMFFYLLLICTRESRHVHNDLSDSTFSQLAQKYGAACTQFNASIKGKGSDGAASYLQSHPPAVPLGNYTSYLTDNFFKGSYSGGYGGKAWGKVAEVLRDFVLGKLTAEMMMDTSFTLCHNNGPIFNKGMLFDSYSEKIYRILDVQRSGQIPQFVAENPTDYGGLNHKLWQQCRQLLGSAFDGYVDWYLVEELGALKSYTSDQKAQVAKHGYPEKYKAKMEIEELKKQQAKAAAEKLAKSAVLLHPGCVIHKVEVVR